MTPAAPTVGGFRVRQFAEDDAAAAETVLRDAFAGCEEDFPAVAAALATGIAVLAQTGSRFLVAERDGHIVGVVRWGDDDGIACLDLLASCAPRAGVALVTSVEQRAQDAGLRLLRASVPEDTALEDYFAHRGFVGVARRPGPNGSTTLVMEKRLPLLTVREQRRSDAAAIAALTGEDPWPFEQGARPGWFVLADGDRVVGAVAARTGRDGVARIRVPALRDGYRGRGLEVWMAERAALWAETNGAHTAELEAAPELEPLRRDFEDRRWERTGGLYVKRATGRPLESGLGEPFD